MSDHIEIKADLAVDDAGMITGMAWPFGGPDRIGDEILPGAFKSAKAPLPILMGHDTMQPLGAWSVIRETNKGLEVKGQLSSMTLVRAKEASALVKSWSAHRTQYRLRHQERHGAQGRRPDNQSS